jgi:ATP-dependent helicase IRC3
MYEQQTSEFYREYDLTSARKHLPLKILASHQTAALERLYTWFSRKPTVAGGILVLPTGGGKTFTAIRFLCSGPSLRGIKFFG